MDLRKRAGKIVLAIWCDKPTAVASDGFRAFMRQAGEDRIIKLVQAEIEWLRSRKGLIELCQAQRRKDDVAIRTWARRQREAAEAAEGE